MAREPRPAPPLPASLAPEAEAMPAPSMRPFAFGALLMRVADGGAVLTDMACGYNYGFSQEQAQSEFVRQVQMAYPGHSITKVAGNEVQPLPQPEPAAVEPPAAA